MEESILVTIKKLLGLDKDYTAFDLDVITHINTALFSLHQLGIGPVNGFSIESDMELWSDLGVPPNKFEALKSYIYLKTRMLFDPPASGTISTSFTEQINQLEWRLNMQYETSTP